MNTKTIQHIKDLINQGHWVEVKDTDGIEVILVSNHIYKDNVFVSNDCAPWDESTLKDCFTNEYKVVTRPPTGLKVGDLVEILDTPELREISKRWSNEAAEMIGQKNLEIESLGIAVIIYRKDKRDYWSFPYWAVAKCLPEEKIELTDDELKQELERRGLLVDGKVLK